MGDFRRDRYMLDRHIASPLDFVANVKAGSFFVTRAKSNLKAERRYSHPVDRTQGLICDQTMVLSGFYSQLPLTIADLYRTMRRRRPSHRCEADTRGPVRSRYRLGDSD